MSGRSCFDKLSMTVVLLTAVVFSCGPARAEELSTLQASFLRGDYSGVVREIRGMEREGRTLNDGTLYLWGVCALKMDQTEEGRTALQRLMSQYPSSRWLAPGRIALGQSLEDEARDEEALKVYQDFLEEQGNGPYSAQAALRLGRVQMRLGQWQESRATLDKVTRRSPNSLEASAARDLLRQGTFYYCVQVGSFSAEPNAQKLSSALKKRGYASEVSEGVLGAQTFYRVRIGRFSSRAQAEEELKRLKQDGFPGRIFP